MKNFVLGTFAGIALMLTLAATPVASQLFIFKPATPVSTVSYNGSNPVTFIKEWIPKGYQVQILSCGSYNACVVVMVKY